MRLNSNFIQLQCQFDKEILQKEVLMLPKSAWSTHPQGFVGNSALALIARNGDSKDDSTFGTMMATQWLEKLPYIKAVLASFKVPLGRTRLMRIKGDSQVPSHTDLDYYWQSRMRIHVPILTNSHVVFECGGETVHMASGQAWVFDTTQLHRVNNPSDSERIHLVIDSVGSEFFFSLFMGEHSTSSCEVIMNSKIASSLDSYLESPPKLLFETQNRPSVMSPFEQREILMQLMDLFSEQHSLKLIKSIESQLQPVFRDWNALWAVHGTQQSGYEYYKRLQFRMSEIAKDCAKGLQFRGSLVELWLRHWLVEPALDIQKTSTASEVLEKPQLSENKIETRFESQYTESMSGLIAHLGGTLVATTYASNRIVLLRSDGDRLNTHFKVYSGPMGMAFDGQKLALGAQNSIWLFRSQADLEASLQPNCDAVFVPSKRHMTGDIRVHELGWSEDELWFVNTRFSCLATLDDDHSFVPRWHPKFIQKLSAEDACHLNGMAMKHGKPAWVSALGVSSEPGGWRENKRKGGVLIELASGEITSSGLCMPHSPRWHGDTLWVLDSGKGELCQVDPQTGKRQIVVRLPGFTRGLAMIDRYAFIGCSRVREAAFFGGLPILEREQPPECGIWAVDLVTGEIIGWLKFAEGIDEIFDLQWMPQLRWPEILEADETIARNGFVLPEDKLFSFK